MKARTGQIFRAPAGSWAIRLCDATGRRHPRNGFATKGEAKAALDDELKRARLGVVHRPDRTFAGKVVDAFLEQHDAAPSSVDCIGTNIGGAIDRFGDRPIVILHATRSARGERHCRALTGIGRIGRSVRCSTRPCGGSGSTRTLRP
jgi:hypothetical protein